MNHKIKKILDNQNKIVEILLNIEQKYILTNKILDKTIEDVKQIKLQLQIA